MDKTKCMTRTIELMVLKTEFMAVPSSLVQPGNPEDTILILLPNSNFKPLWSPPLAGTFYTDLLDQANETNGILGKPAFRLVWLQLEFR